MKPPDPRHCPATASGSRSGSQMRYCYGSATLPFGVAAAVGGTGDGPAAAAVVAAVATVPGADFGADVTAVVVGRVAPSFAPSD